MLVVFFLSAFFHEVSQTPLAIDISEVLVSESVCVSAVLGQCSSTDATSLGFHCHALPGGLLVRAYTHYTTLSGWVAG